MQFRSAKIDITPDFPCSLMGTENGIQSKGIFSRIEANAMEFASETQHVYFISLDTLFITGELKQAIHQLINVFFGQTEERDVITLASHTHYAPALEKNRVKLGAKDEKYYAFLLAQLEQLLGDLKAASLVDVELRYAENVSQGITCNRRRKARVIRNYFKSFIAMEPNPTGFTDERFKLLNIRNAKSKEFLGTIWSFPCHPTNFPEKNTISAEFPGEVRNELRKFNRSEAPIIYFPGFAGDVRAMPPKRRSIFKLIRSIFQLSYPVSYYRFATIEEYTAWKTALVAGFMRANADEHPLNCAGAELETSISEEPLTNLGIQVEAIENLQFRKIKIGQDFAIYTISAEPVGKYVELFRSNSSDKFAIYSGYADAVFGYLPTQEHILEKGYESEGFFDAFLVKGNFNGTVESTVISHINKLNHVR